MQDTITHKPEIDLSDRPTRIRVIGYTYLVDFGPTTQPRFHIVDKHRRCSCELSEECPAIEAVAEYLRHGGPRAPDPMPACPICGAETVRDRHWNGRYTKELGWRCTAGGISHFLQAKAERIKQGAFTAIKQRPANTKVKLAAVLFNGGKHASTHVRKHGARSDAGADRRAVPLLGMRVA